MLDQTALWTVMSDQTARSAVLHWKPSFPKAEGMAFFVSSICRVKCSQKRYWGWAWQGPTAQPTVGSIASMLDRDTRSVKVRPSAAPTAQVGFCSIRIGLADCHLTACCSLGQPEPRPLRMRAAAPGPKASGIAREVARIRPEVPRFVPSVVGLKDCAIRSKRC